MVSGLCDADSIDRIVDGLAEWWSECRLGDLCSACRHELCQVSTVVLVGVVSVVVTLAALDSYSIAECLVEGKSVLEVGGVVGLVDGVEIVVGDLECNDEAD